MRIAMLVPTFTAVTTSEPARAAPAMTGGTQVDATEFRAILERLRGAAIEVPRLTDAGAQTESPTKEDEVEEKHRPSMPSEEAHTIHVPLHDGVLVAGPDAAEPLVGVSDIDIATLAEPRIESAIQPAPKVGAEVSETINSEMVSAHAVILQSAVADTVKADWIDRAPLSDGPVSLDGRSFRLTEGPRHAGPKVKTDGLPSLPQEISEALPPTEIPDPNDPVIDTMAIRNVTLSLVPVARPANEHGVHPLPAPAELIASRQTIDLPASSTWGSSFKPQSFWELASVPVEVARDTQQTTVKTAPSTVKARPVEVPQRPLLTPLPTESKILEEIALPQRSPEGSERAHQLEAAMPLRRSLLAEPSLKMPDVTTAQADPKVAQSAVGPSAQPKVAVPEITVTDAAPEPIIRADTSIGSSQSVVPQIFAAPVRPVGPPPSVQAVASAIVAPGPDRVELRLSPEELGIVRIAMSTADGGLSVTITAERDDTLALLRRHAADLRSALADLGMGSADIDFGSSGGGNNERPSSTVAAHTESRAADNAAPDIFASDGLDIRV